ncbi:uncharacterized protein [Primulina eburnea]|uniref:uncharacterized protein n=1 Tax=Primulina eburnea TaxID=1245227 RepID=UPI003C6C9699
MRYASIYKICFQRITDRDAVMVAKIQPRETMLQEEISMNFKKQSRVNKRTLLVSYLLSSSSLQTEKKTKWEAVQNSNCQHTPATEILDPYSDADAFMEWYSDERVGKFCTWDTTLPKKLPLITHLERREAVVDVENPASQRVLGKAGFTREVSEEVLHDEGQEMLSCLASCILYYLMDT